MRKVMIIDDNQTNLKMMDLILSKAGFKTDCIVKPEFALDIIKETKPNLILLDINMPNINGFQLCKMIKKTKDIKDIPVIFISALSDVHYIAGGLALGAVDYITKPIKAEEVVARVSVQMELAKTRQKLVKTNEQLQTELNNKNIENFDAEADFVYALSQIKNGNFTQKDYERVKDYIDYCINEALKTSQVQDFDKNFIYDVIKKAIF